MANKRKSFLLHIDSLDILDDLSDEQAGMLFRAIKSHQKREPIELDPMVKIAFSPFKNQFARDDKKYQTIIDRNKNNGLKGGRPKTQANPDKPTGLSGNPDNPSKADSVSDNDSDSDSKRLKEAEHEALLNDGFNIFYSAGLPKKAKVKALAKFKSLAKQMKADPIEFGQLLASDVQTRIAKQQFGINKLHPSTYLNNQRWTDEHETNNGQLTPNGKQSASERIAARNNAKYGEQPSGGLGMAESGGDLRGAVGEREWRDPITYVESSAEQVGSIDCEEWREADN